MDKDRKKPHDILVNGERDGILLETALLRLKSITKLMKFVGFLALILTLVHLASVSTFVLRLFPSGYGDFVLWILSTGGISIINLLLFDYMRRSGETLFEEISDELQWNVRDRFLNEASASGEVPPFDIRLILRTFSKTTDLPLFPGKFGAAAYSVINFTLILFGIWLAVVRGS